MKRFLCVMFLLAGCHAKEPAHKQGSFTKEQLATLRAIDDERQIVQLKTQQLNAEQNEIMAAACAAIGVPKEEAEKGDCKADRLANRVWYEKPPDPPKGKK